MPKVLFGDPAQTKLAFNFFANESQLIVAGTTCFPVIAENSGDSFYVYLVRPATQCAGVYKEVVKVVSTDKNIWKIERVSNQCGKSGMDFFSGDTVYYDPCLGQALDAAFAGQAQTTIETYTSHSAQCGERIILRPVDNVLNTLFLPANPPDKCKFMALKTRNGAGTSGYTINPQGRTLNRLSGGSWDLPDYTWITFTHYANSNDWLVTIGDQAVSLKQVLDIPETVVNSDTTIDGDGSSTSPLSINAKTSSPIEGNGKVGNPLKINYVDLTSSIAGSGTKANNGKLDADIHVNSPLSGKGTAASPLAIGDASGTDKGVVSLTIESEIPAQNGSDDTAITPKAVKKLVKYIKPVAASGAMSAEQQSANAIPVPFLQNFTCDGGTNGKPKFDVPLENGNFCNIDLGLLGGGGGGGPTTVWAGSSTGCVNVPDTGLYYAEIKVKIHGQFFAKYVAFINMSGVPTDEPVPGVPPPDRCLTLLTLTDNVAGTYMINPFNTAYGQVTVYPGSGDVILTKIVRVG